ncbi:MAG: hypothetical protein LBH94_00915, partial [Deltaproteobacteria bacterium]|nr:hypothetical protein [Deltaproteobacteria bacterium]
MTEHVLPEESPAPKAKRGRRAVSKKKTDETSPPAALSAPESTGDEGARAEEMQAAKPKSRRSRRGGRKRAKNPSSPDQHAVVDEGGASLAPSSTQRGAEETAPKAEEDPDRPAQRPKSAGAKQKMFISIVPGEQAEVVLTEQGGVCEYYLEMFHH